jgi:raffinose/stachyose/melibiose transport system permease protein
MSSVLAATPAADNAASREAAKAPVAARQNGPKRAKLRINPYVWYVIPGVLAFLVVIGGSFGATIYTSFTTWNGLGTAKFVGFKNYITLMGDEVFWQSFLHAGVFVVTMALIPSALGLFVAALLFDYIAPRFGARISAAMRAMFFVPQIIPITVSGVLWVWLLSPNDGVINTILRNIGASNVALNWLGDPQYAIWAVSAMLIWIQIGYSIVIFMSGLSRLDPSLSEAAQLDGASWFQRFRMITFFQVRPELSVVLLTTTVAALKVFAPVYVMTQGGPGNATTVPAFFSYYQFFTTTKVGYGSAVATVLALILTVIAIVILNVQNRQGDNK